MAEPTRWAVVCDFDGTAVTEDIGDQNPVAMVWYFPANSYR